MTTDILSPLFHTHYPAPALLAAIGHGWHSASGSPGPRWGSILLSPPNPSNATAVNDGPPVYSHFTAKGPLAKGQHRKSCFQGPQKEPAPGGLGGFLSSRRLQGTTTYCSTNQPKLDICLIYEIFLRRSKGSRWLASTHIVLGYWAWPAWCQHFLAAGCTSLASLGNSVPSFENWPQRWKYDLENGHKSVLN